MNNNQKILLTIVSIVLFLMLLFPPWHNKFFAAPSYYSFIFISPSLAHSINSGVLFMQYLFVLTIGGILYFVLKDKNGKKRIDKTKDGSELPENSEKENMINE